MTIDELLALYAKRWGGFRMDGKGFLVPDVSRKELVEKHSLATVAAQFKTKAYDPKQKLFLAGVANAHEVDRMREVVTPTGGNFTPFGKNPVLLWMHNHYAPIGQVPVLKAENHGVLFEGWCGDPAAAPLTQTQVDTRNLIAQRILKAVSIGFIPLKIKYPTYNDRGEMVDPAVIEEWEMLELSVVSVPANAGALFEAKGGKAAVQAALREALKLWSFPTLGADGRLNLKTKEKSKMDEELKALLEKLGVTLDSIGAGINKLADGQATLQKSLDAMGAAGKGNKPKECEDDKEDEEDEEDEEMKALVADVAAQKARLDALEKTTKTTFDIVSKLAEKAGVKVA